MLEVPVGVFSRLAFVHSRATVRCSERRAARTGWGDAGHDAGWSSPVARWAHNPKVAGSNPAPATKKFEAALQLSAAFSFWLRGTGFEPSLCRNHGAFGAALLLPAPATKNLRRKITQVFRPSCLGVIPNPAAALLDPDLRLQLHAGQEHDSPSEMA